MEIELNLDESIHKNIGNYFEKAKKAEAKAEKIREAMKVVEQKIKKLESKAQNEQKKTPISKRPREWYEKFRWSFSSDGFLILAGRDANTNELLISKYMEPKDLYFHADVYGAAHCIIKTNGNNPGENTLKEAAVFAAVFSKAWQDGLNSVDVYSVKPEQVSKKAPSGESLGFGAYVIYGKRNWFKNTPLKFAIGIEKAGEHYRVISGPPEAIEKKALTSFRIVQGKKKKSEVAKQLKAAFEKATNCPISIDEIMQMLPADKMEIQRSQ
ncbi:MAG: NFACT RNA binding domain-containing protein [Candidatus Diapherotrites archaeon]|nr:NFACT RNA binding domain-containing protein [Candidatus Diapherotrites archaeon]